MSIPSRVLPNVEMRAPPRASQNVVYELLEVHRRKTFDHSENSLLIVTAGVAALCRIGISLITNDAQYGPAKPLECR